MQGRRIPMVLTACQTHDRSDVVVQVINDGIAHVQIRTMRVEEANTVAISIRSPDMLRLYTHTQNPYTYVCMLFSFLYLLINARNNRLLVCSLVQLLVADTKMTCVY